MRALVAGLAVMTEIFFGIAARILTPRVTSTGRRSRAVDEGPGAQAAAAGVAG